MDRKHTKMRERHTPTNTEIERSEIRTKKRNKHAEEQKNAHTKPNTEKSTHKKKNKQHKMFYKSNVNVVSALALIPPYIFTIFSTHIY